MDVKDPVPAPAEVLIPEARDHQKRRYLWTGVVAALAALVLAALIGGAVVFFSSSPAGSGARRPAAPPALASSASYVYFRPVLCVAPAYSPGPTPSVGPTTLPTCDSTSLLTASNLGVTPIGTAPDGFSENNVAPDGSLAGIPTTAPSTDQASANSTVLLPATPGSDGFAAGQRLVLGPVEMTNTSVGSASAHKDQTGQWVVDYTMKSGGSARWDLVAEQNFHQLLGIDLDGKVVSAPIIQPTQSSFSSFDGHGEVSGNLSRAEAVSLARALTSHRD